MEDKVVHYYPSARVVVVKGYSNDDIVTSDQMIQLDLTQITSIHTTRTIRGSPGTFSLNLLNTNNSLMKPDNPEQEIQLLVNSAQSQAEFERARLGFAATDKGGASFYEFKSYYDWLAFDHIALEEQDAAHTRYLSYYRRDGSRRIVERWAIDSTNSLIRIVPDQTTEVALQKLADGTVKTFSVIGGKSRAFVVRKFSNESLLSKTNFQFDHGRCKISPMDRIVIFYTRRFVKTTNAWQVQSSPEGTLIRSFTGLVNNVTPMYQENNTVISVDGEDVTKWMKLSVLNVNPAAWAGKGRGGGIMPIEQDIVSGQATGANASFAAIKFGKVTPPDMIKFLTLGSRGLDKTGHTEGVKGINEPGIGVYKLQTVNKPSKWEYDMTTQSYVERSTNLKVSVVDITSMLGTLFSKSSVHVIDITQFGLKAWEPYEIDSTSWQKYQSDFRDRREMAYEVASQINFLFYADRNGEIWFTPPRYNNGWILSAENPDVFVIDDQSIISYSFLETDEQIYTNVIVTPRGDLTSMPEESVQAAGLFGWYQDDDLVLKYGTRVLVEHNPLLKKMETAFLTYYAKHRIQQLLADRLNGSITLVGRPEIEEGHPVYVPYFNMIYLVETVEDSLTVNGEFTTTISVSHGHKPWDYIPEFMTYGSGLEAKYSDSVIDPNRSRGGAQTDPTVVDQGTAFEEEVRQRTIAFRKEMGTGARGVFHPHFVPDPLKVDAARQENESE